MILFGETGAGKSSIINLLAEHEVADISSNLQGCTLEAREHSFTFPGPMVLNIFDTVGLGEPEMGVNTFFGAIKQAHELIESLHSAGGVDLLVFCVRAGRITAALQRNYRLFFDVLCGGKVPLAIVVTNTEQEKVMENWWINNAATFQSYGIHSSAHACITALPADTVTLAYAHKRVESRKTLRTMLINALRNTNSPYARDKRGWLITIVSKLRSLVTKKSGSFKKKDILRRLEKECMLNCSDAEELAHLLTTRT